MKKYFVFLFAMLSSHLLLAQESIPFTQNAMQIYDLRFKGSGFKNVGHGTFNSKALEKISASFNIDTLHDYIFMAFADSTTKGIRIEGRLNSDTTVLFHSDETYVFKESGAQIMIFPIDEKFNASLKITMNILGKKDPAEPSYYILFEQIRIY